MMIDSKKEQCLNEPALIVVTLSGIVKFDLPQGKATKVVFPLSNKTPSIET